MRLLIASMTTAIVLTGAATAQTQQGGAAPVTKDRPTATSPNAAGSNTTGVAPRTPSGERPTGPAIGRPNEPRAYGETNSGNRVNPDRVPPTSPGGQGERDR
jgi:hypothetical protein